MSKWPLKIRFWKYINHLTARLAWKYANPGGADWGKALRVDDKKLLWRLNNWVSGHWVPWYINSKRGRS